MFLYCISRLQVRYTQLVWQKKRKLAGRIVGGAWRGAGSMSEGRLGTRNWSRRSGYAFAHQEGFGELITSGKNMWLSSLALTSFASKHSSSWIDTLRRKRHTPPCASADCSPAPSCASASVPPLSNSSSVLGSSQDTPIEEEASAAEQKVLSLSSSSQLPPTPAREAPIQPPGDTVTLAATRPPVRGDSSGGWANTLVSVQVSQPPKSSRIKLNHHSFHFHPKQEALCGWKSRAATPNSTCAENSQMG